MTQVLVLYEDSRGANGQFGPHEFFLGCVADDKRASVHELRPKARAMPVRGVAKLLQLLRNLEDLDHLVARGGQVMAVIDEDHLADHYPEAAGLDAHQIERRLVAESSAPTRLSVVLLEQNMESVVAAMRDCGEQSHALLEAALRKSVNDRDTLFSRVGHDPGRRAIRDCVRRTMAGVERIVQWLGSAVA